MTESVSTTVEGPGAAEAGAEPKPHEVAAAAARNAWEVARVAMEISQGVANAARARAQAIKDTTVAAKKAAEEALKSHATALDRTALAFELASAAKKAAYDHAASVQRASEAARVRFADAKANAQNAGASTKAFEDARARATDKAAAEAKALAASDEATRLLERAGKEAEGARAITAGCRENAAAAERALELANEKLRLASEAAKRARDELAGATTSGEIVAGHAKSVAETARVAEAALDKVRATLAAAEVEATQAALVASKAAEAATTATTAMAQARGAAAIRAAAAATALAADELSKRAEDEERTAAVVAAASEAVASAEKAAIAAREAAALAAKESAVAEAPVADARAAVASAESFEAAAQGDVDAARATLSRETEALQRATEAELNAVLQGSEAAQAAETTRATLQAATDDARRASEAALGLEQAALAEKEVHDGLLAKMRLAEKDAQELRAEWERFRREARAANDRVVLAQNALEGLEAATPALTRELAPPPAAPAPAAVPAAALEPAPPTKKQSRPSMPVPKIATGASLRLTVSAPDQPPTSYALNRDVVVLGRDSTCDVHLDSMLVSRRHAEIRRNETFFALVDQNTGNGTFLNGKRISGLSLLNDGDAIGLGNYRIRFEAETATAFGPLPAANTIESDSSSGMTIQMSTSMEKRVAEEVSGRVRGYVVLSHPDLPPESDIKLFVADTFQIGKGPECDLAIRGWFVPRKAAVIVRGTDRYMLMNVSSSPSAILLDDKPIADKAPLADGSRIEVYGETFRFSVPAAENP